MFLVEGFDTRWPRRANISGKRGSGRTTRMIKAALKAGENGEDIIIVGANAKQTDHLRFVADGLLHDPGDTSHKYFPTRDTRLPNGGRIRFNTPDRHEINLRRARHEDEPRLFVDHYAVEQELARIEEEWRNCMSYLKDYREI